MIGQTLAHYEILDQLGEGGMGTVYRARDTRLQREVAIKVLPPEWADDPERLARFEREARSLAALNHAHIATVHGFEEAGGRHLLVMELVEGEDLAQRLARGPLPVDELLRLADELCLGLQAAHDAGIVHRDLKPANIRLDAKGRAKILDFGLARAQASEVDPEALANSPTVAQSMTAAGVLLGTAAYMSPEQAKGYAVDRRADMWALGCVLYEALTAKQAFGGETITDVLANIVRGEPDWDALPGDTPPRLRQLLEHCLQKDADERLADAGAARLWLRDAGQAEAAPGPGRAMPVPLLAGAGLLLLLAGFAGARLLGGPAPGDAAGPAHMVVVPATDLAGVQSDPALSPDGRQMAFVQVDGSDSDIFLLRVGGENATNLTANHDGMDDDPAFSPDGQRIAFASGRDGGGVFVMGATGEDPRRVTPPGHFEPAWSPGGRYLATSTEHIRDPFSRNGSSEIWITDLEGEEAPRSVAGIDASSPSWSPDGRFLTFWCHLHPVSGQRDLYTIPAAGGEAIPVLVDAPTDWDPLWSPDGRWIYFISDRGGTPDLWRLPVDPGTGEATGPPQAVSTGPSRIMEFSMSRDGRLLLAAHSNRTDILAFTLDPQLARAEGRGRLLLSTASMAIQPDIDPVREYLYYRTASPHEYIYRIGFDGQQRFKLLGDEHRNRGPSPSPDGEWVAFYSNRDGDYDLFLMRPDGTGLRQVTNSGGGNDPTWLPTGDLSATVLDGSRQYTVRIELPEGGPAAIDAPLPGEMIPGTEGFQVYYWSRDARRGTGIRGRSLEPAWYDAVAQEVREFEGLAREFDANRMPRFLDDTRVLGWSATLQCVLLADLATGEARCVEGLPGPSEIVTTGGGRRVFAFVERPDSELWLLEPAP